MAFEVHDSNDIQISQTRALSLNIRLSISLIHLSCFLLLGIGPRADASEISPFYTRNQSPFIHIFGFPTAQPGTLVPFEQVETRAIFEVINNYTRDLRTRQRIVIDGETYRGTLQFRWGMAKKLEAGIDLAYLSHNQGFLDSFIENWHDIFGFSNKKRQKFQRNQLLYSINSYQAKDIYVHQHEAGPGDLLLSLAFPLSTVKGGASTAVALRTGLKLPTGNSETLHGSGGTDLYLSLNASDKAIEILWPLNFFGGLGLLMTGNADILEKQQRHQIFFGNLGIGGHFGKWLDLKLQIDMHSPFFNNPAQQLGVFSSQLIMGGTLNLPQKFFMDLAVSEDLIKDTAPDLLFHIAVRRLF
ncbi:MAG: DUF3187 family protein [SAR324 cluster bacterium]|nr:DUF3187 family protein [SAR324 cluster bacterium]